MERTHSTPLPPPPGRVPIADLIVKEAVGFALWNGCNGSDAKLYLGKMSRADRPGELIRYLGGTAVPQSSVSSWNQSLLRLQDYVGESVPQEMIVDFTVLHRGYYFSEEMYSDPALPGSGTQSQAQHMADGVLSHLAPGYEIHGVLRASQDFVERHRDKLVELAIAPGGRVRIEPRLAFNNDALVRITRHILACLLYRHLRCAVVINPALDRKVTPYMDMESITPEDMVQ